MTVALKKKSIPFLAKKLKIIVISLAFGFICVPAAYACGGGMTHGNDGCATSINGINIWHDGLMEIDVQGKITWHTSAACNGTYLLRIPASDPGYSAKLSVALAAYTSKDEVTFRCSQKLSPTECQCQHVVIGNHARD